MMKSNRIIKTSTQKIKLTLSIISMSFCLWWNPNFLMLFHAITLEISVKSIAGVPSLSSRYELSPPSSTYPSPSSGRSVPIWNIFFHNLSFFLGREFSEFAAAYPFIFRSSCSFSFGSSWLFLLLFYFNLLTF